MPYFYFGLIFVSFTNYFLQINKSINIMSKFRIFSTAVFIEDSLHEFFIREPAVSVPTEPCFHLPYPGQHVQVWG